MNYRRLLNLKRLDVYGQLLAMFGPMVFTAVGGRELFAGIFASYVLTGGWQLISMGATMAYDDPEKRWKSRMRRWYHIMILVLVFVGMLCIMNDDIIQLYLYTLLFVTPIMALLYLVLSFLELVALTNRKEAETPDLNGPQ